MHTVDTKEQRTIIKKAFSPELYKLLQDAKAILAGGAISSIFTNRPVNDFDVYFQKEADLDIVERYLKSKDNWEFNFKSSFTSTYTNKTPITISLVDYGDSYINKLNNVKLQLVSALYVDEDTIFSTFDFHCCMGLYSFASGEFKFDRYFLSDNMSKKIRYNIYTSANAVSSLIRVDKYKSYGYKLSNDELLKIVLNISRIKLTTMKDALYFFKTLPISFHRRVILEELYYKPLSTLIGPVRKPMTDEDYVKYKEYMNSPFSLNAFIDSIGNINDYIAVTHDNDKAIKNSKPVDDFNADDGDEVLDKILKDLE
jgi:hypothetical protein